MCIIFVFYCEEMFMLQTLFKYPQYSVQPLKYLFLFCLFSLSTVVNAEIRDYTQCNLFDIRIKNESQNDCIIKKYYLPLGEFGRKSQMPEVIFRNREAKFSLTNSENLKISDSDGDYLQTEVLISVECGEDTEITLYANTPFIQKSTVLEQKNIKARFISQLCSNLKGKTRPWEIVWTLLPNDENET